MAFTHEFLRQYNSFRQRVTWVPESGGLGVGSSCFLGSISMEKMKMLRRKMAVYLQDSVSVLNTLNSTYLKGCFCHNFFLS